MHPLDFLTLGYAGSLLAEAVPLGLGQAGAALAAATLLALGALAAWNGQARLPRLGKAALPLLLAASGALAGAAVPAFQRWMVPSHHLLRNLPYGSVNLIGHLAQPLERNQERSGRRPRLTVEVERLVVRGVDVPARGTARITLSTILEQPLEVGDRILVRGVRLYPPRRYLNPDGFDYREFMRLLGVHAAGFAHPRAVTRLAPREEAAWRRALFGMRERMRAHLRNALPGDAAGLMEVMTIGVREELDPEIRTAFRLTGTAHLLAISGLHVGFIAAFFYFLLRHTFRRLPPAWFPYRPVVLTPDKAASLGTIPMIVLFALLSGARVSTVRAAIMGVAYLTARVLERKGGALHSVLLAGLFILLLEPAFIWDAGFQLSFVAVTAIILGVRRGSPGQPGGNPGRLVRWRRWGKEFAWVQVVVSMAVAPLTAWHFQEAQVIGLLVNLLVIPIASLAVPLAFLFAMAGAALPHAMEALLWPFDGLLALLARAMILLTRWGSALPGGSWTVPPPSRGLMAAFFLLFLLALGARRMVWRKAGWAGAMAAILWMIFPFPATLGSPSATGRTALLLPDAGRADVFLLRLPDGRGFAVDGGGESGGFDTWGNVVGPLLRRTRNTDWEALFALSPDTAPLAARELGSAMRLARTFGPDSGGERRPGVAGAPRTVWETSSPPARLRLLRWPAGASAFEVAHGGARWLLFAGRVSGAFDAGALPGRGYDVIRLPETLLERSDVLAWLTRERPAVLIASPWRSGRIPPRDWREIRARQNALGVYRPWRLGMARLETAGGPIGRGGEMVRYEMAASWPAVSTGRWAAWRPSPPIRTDEADASEGDE